MNRVNRLLLAAALAGGVCCGVGMVRAGWMNGGQAVRRLDEEHHKYPHMHHAMDKLKDARHELEQSEDVFRGQKADALKHVDAAIDEIKTGLKEQNDEASVAGEVPTARPLDDYPHLHGALDRLREARDELKSADPVFHHHRDNALEHTKAAIKQLDDVLHEQER
jgi:ElaB/YqjD/DUF883 family membrane-anchored ribosome-binding protein